MRYIDIKGNFLLIRGDLNDKERGLVKCILYFINDVADGITAVPAMREDKGQKFIRGLKNVLGWIDKIILLLGISLVHCWMLSER